MGCGDILTHMDAPDGTSRPHRGAEVELHCAKCGKRLARVPARLRNGHVVLLNDREGDDLIEPGPIDQDSRAYPALGLSGGEVIVLRAENAASRLPKQLGPRTGYHEAQATHTSSDDRPRVFGRKPDPWRWSCPCGKRTSIPDDRLCKLVERALARGEHDITLR